MDRTTPCRIRACARAGQATAAGAAVCLAGAAVCLAGAAVCLAGAAAGAPREIPSLRPLAPCLRATAGGSSDPRRATGVAGLRAMGASAAAELCLVSRAAAGASMDGAGA